VDQPVKQFGRIGRYEILSELSLQERRLIQRRFLLEARAAGRLDHPGVVAIYDADRDALSGEFYIAMERVDGSSLHSMIERRAPLPGDEAISIARQVALALDTAHREGLIHRDIKPGNVLIDRAGTAKLTDFGIAKFQSLTLTMAGRIVGSPFYMSPEQVRGDPVDGRSDLFSLGIVLYRSLTGVAPFGGETLADISYKILEIDARPVQTVNPRVSDRLAEIVSRSLAKEPRLRFQSGQEFAAALDSVGTGLPAKSDPTAKPPATRPHRATRARDAGDRTLVLDPERPRINLWRRIGYRLCEAAILLLSLLPWALTSESSNAPLIPRGALLSVTEGYSQRLAAAQEPVLVLPEVEPPPNAIEVPPKPKEPALVPVARESLTSGLPPAAATLEVLYKNRLKAGWLSLWVDSEPVWSRQFSGSGNLLRRAAGQTVRGIVPVSVGEHVVKVRVTGAGGKVDATQRDEVVFAEDERRILKVSLKLNGKLKLSWKEPGYG
jgi:serine/threonine protein kinase